MIELQILIIEEQNLLRIGSGLGLGRLGLLDLIVRTLLANANEASVRASTAHANVDLGILLVLMKVNTPKRRFRVPQ